jgi:GcrA cell cycle regulator
VTPLFEGAAFTLFLLQHRHGPPRRRAEHVVMQGESWSFERVALLRRLWADGVSAADIGERLGGLSRSAVLGKVFRLRLIKQAADDAASMRHWPDAANKSDGAVPARRRRPQPRRRQESSAPAVLSRHKSLLDLTNTTCRWPHGRPGTARFFFCGASGADLEAGIPYCAQHMRRAYRSATSGGKTTQVAGKAPKSQPKETV